MKNLLALTLMLVVLNTSDALAQDKWQQATSRDGVVQVLLPGKPVSKVDKRSSWAGTIKSYVTIYKATGVKYAVSSTSLSSMVKRFVSDEKIFVSAKEGVLSEAFGHEISFEKITVNGIPARKLRYEVVQVGDKKHTGFHGVAVFVIHNNTTYVANARIRKDAGEADLIKFCDSVKVNKQTVTKK